MNQRQLDKKLEEFKTMDEQTMFKESMEILIKSETHRLTGEEEYYYKLLRKTLLKKVGLESIDNN